MQATQTIETRKRSTVSRDFFRPQSKRYVMTKTKLSRLANFVVRYGGAISFYALFSVGLAILALDWFGGCGEVFHAADGSLIAGECIGRETLRDVLSRFF